MSLTLTCTELIVSLIKGEHLFTLDYNALHYPNDIIAIDENMLAIADTNNHRVRFLHVDAKGKVQERQQIDLHQEKRNWPTQIAQDRDNNIWVVHADGALDRTNLSIYALNPQGKYQKIKYCDTVSEIASINRFDNRMLVGDKSPYALEILSSSKRIPFGDEAFQTLINQTDIRLKTYNFQKYIAQVGIGLSIVLLLMAAKIEYSRAEDKKVFLHKMNHL